MQLPLPTIVGLYFFFGGGFGNMCKRRGIFRGWVMWRERRERERERLADGT